MNIHSCLKIVNSFYSEKSLKNARTLWQSCHMKIDDSKAQTTQKHDVSLKRQKNLFF